MTSELSTVQVETLRALGSLEYILVGDLRSVLEEPPTKETQKWMRVLIDALLETIPREFQLREIGGYLTEVIEEYPSWSPHVEKLRDEHFTLEYSLRNLRNRLCENKEGLTARAIQSLKKDLRDWMNSLVAHNRHETRILQDAFNLEIGAAD